MNVKSIDCPLHKNPFRQFEHWYQEATLGGEIQADAMTLATASKKGRPSARVVLYKGIQKGGFLIFTNYGSPKAKEMMANPQATLVFHWPKLDRQVRVDGRVVKLSHRESDRYFQSRPRDSQIGALASRQSEIIANRHVLEERFAEIARLYEGRKIPCPDYWGGFRLVPHSLEFWLGRANRLHDRFLYTRQASRWKIQRLSP